MFFERQFSFQLLRLITCVNTYATMLFILGFYLDNLRKSYMLFGDIPNLRCFVPDFIV